MSCSKYVVKISSEKDMKIVAPPHTIYQAQYPKGI